MTHNTENLEIENQGSKDVAYHEINITSLDSAGKEQYDPESETKLSGADRFGIDVRSQTNETFRAFWNETDQNLTVKDVSDNTDAANNANVGHFTLEVIGE